MNDNHLIQIILFTWSKYFIHIIHFNEYKKKSRKQKSLSIQ